ncbi:MAG: class I SAM-dependent methyltransferase [Halofilum sp. (in: g-proteobacteria)]|nr:class I SAM-dependent methyltransferase [Halofilum sp. (in: g-proteobacteria)]
MMRSGFEDAWRRRFVERGSRFRDEAEIAGWSRTGLDTRFRRFRALWPGDAPGNLWLDAGCGAGTYTRFLRESGLDALGLDYSSPSLAKARARAGDAGWWVAADVKQLPLRSASVDGVLCFGVMQALDDPQPALAELLRVTRPGGTCWVDGLNRWCLPNLLREGKRMLLGRAPHLRYDAPGSLRRSLRAAGSDGVRLHWLPMAPERFPRLRRLLAHPLTEQLLRVVPPLGLLCSHSFILVARRGRA